MPQQGSAFNLPAAAAVTSVVSDSVRPHRRQPTRLPRPWDSPGKNTGVGCHFRLQCMQVKSESEVAQSCPTPSDPMDCSLPGFSIHGIFQAGVGCHCLLRQSAYEYVNLHNFVSLQCHVYEHYPRCFFFFLNKNIFLGSCFGNV